MICTHLLHIILLLFPFHLEIIHCQILAMVIYRSITTKVQLFISWNIVAIQICWNLIKERNDVGLFPADKVQRPSQLLSDTPGDKYSVCLSLSLSLSNIPSFCISSLTSAPFYCRQYHRFVFMLIITNPLSYHKLQLSRTWAYERGVVCRSWRSSSRPCVPVLGSAARPFLWIVNIVILVNIINTLSSSAKLSTFWTSLTHCQHRQHIVIIVNIVNTLNKVNVVSAMCARAWLSCQAFSLNCQHCQHFEYCQRRLGHVRQS